MHVAGGGGGEGNFSCLCFPGKTLIWFGNGGEGVLGPSTPLERVLQEGLSSTDKKRIHGKFGSRKGQAVVNPSSFGRWMNRHVVHQTECLRISCSLTMSMIHQ